MAKKNIGMISFGVQVGTKKLRKGLKKARAMIANFVKSLKRVTIAAAGLGVALSAVALTTFTKSAFTSIDSLAKTADKLGITTEALAGLRLAATETGVAANTLDMALQRMVRRVAEAAQGTGEAKSALKELGLSATALNRLSPDQQFHAIAKAMGKVKNQSDRVRLSMKLFDSEGVALVNTLKLGKSGLDEAAQAARDLGLAVSRESARGVERAIDAWGRFKSALQGIFTSIAIEIAPIIEAMSVNLTKLLSQGGAAGSIGKGIGEAIVKMAKFVVDTMQLMRIGFLKLILDIKTLIFQFRNSTAGSALGFGFANESQRLSSFSSTVDSRAAFEKAALAPNLSSMFEPYLKRQLSAVEKEMSGPSLFTRLRESVTGAAGAATDRVAGGVRAGVGAIANDPVNQLIMQSLLGQFRSGGKLPGKAQAVSGLSFAEAGTAEGHRQSARIRRQNDANKKRDGLLTEIRDKIPANPVTLAGANL